MSYIPARDPTVDPPGVADLFSEYLVTPYGRWYTVESSQHLALDGIQKLTRNYSLHCYRGNEGWANQPASTDAFYFSFNKPVDCTNMEKISFLFHAYDRHFDDHTVPFPVTVPILMGIGVVSLVDANMNAIYSPQFQHIVDQKPWNTGVTYDRTAREFKKEQFSGTMLPVFDWTRVIAWTFYIATLEVSIWDFLPPNGYDIWLDGGPFILFSGNASFLEIRCKTADGTPILVGRNMDLTDNANPSVTTPYPIPASYSVPPSSYTIKITDSDFLHWEDGSTAPKVVSVGAGTTTLTAIFGGGLGDLTIPLVAGAIGIGGVALYYLRGRK